MKLFLKTAAALSLLIIASAQAAPAQSPADPGSKIARVERELNDILTAQKNATYIDPEFNDDFDRKIAEKRQELQALKGGML